MDSQPQNPEFRINEPHIYLYLVVFKTENDFNLLRSNFFSMHIKNVSFQKKRCIYHNTIMYTCSDRKSKLLPLLAQSKYSVSI